MLDIDKKPEQQGHAAWAIGSAVKNNFDNFDYDEFQYWLLESDVTHPSELILKTYDKKDKNYNENGNKFENKIDHDGKNDLTGKLNSGIREDFSFDNENHDIHNQNNINNDDKSTNKNDNNIDNDDEINDESDKHCDNDNNGSNELSVIPVTKITSTENQNNSNVNNSNNKYEIIQKSMTGIEKLVSLLHHCTNNESFIMQNRPYLDELQLKVLSAISAANRNVDVLESLFKIEKSDLSVIENGDINRNESSSVGGKINIDQSVFMNYLIKIVEQSYRNNSNNNNNDIDNDKNDKDHDNNNDYNVSYELSRKIWTFIARLLEDMAYERRKMTNLSEKEKEKEKEEFSNLVFMGDFFLTEFWFNLSGKTFERIFHLYTVGIERKPNLNFESNVNGEIVYENNKSQNTENAVSTDLNHGTLLSILENILRVEIVIMSQHEIIKLKLKDEYMRNSNSFLMTLNIVSNLENSECGKLISESKHLLKILA
jgi:hypothetical protein